MKAILIDNDLQALHSLEEALSKLGIFKVITAYTDAREVLAILANEQPDVIFLDTELPTLNGISVARSIQRNLPWIQIAFVTDRHTFAVQAFELDALDYILKPLQPQRLIKTVQKLQRRKQQLTQEPSPFY